MATETVLQGIGVSAGIAIAPVFSLVEAVSRDRAAGSSEQEGELGKGPIRSGRGA